MSTPWITIASVGNLWRIPSAVNLPFKFSEAVSLDELPGWMGVSSSDDELDLLLPKFRERIDSADRYCIVVGYCADALGSNDPNWTGPRPRGIQEAAVEAVRDVFFALWLVRPTVVYFRNLAHVAIRADERLIRQLASYDPLCPLSPSYEGDPYSEIELVHARKLFTVMRDLPQNGTLRTAIQTTASALTEQGWVMRFLKLWLVMESLFGPEDTRETTFRLSQRVALFLTSEKGAAMSLFLQIKKSYGWRSKVVHGLRLAKLTGEESDRLLVELEGIVRSSFSKILADNLVLAAFDNKSREEFLDGLAFR